MLDAKGAVKIVREKLPRHRIGLSVEYRDLFLVQAFSPYPGEEALDPYYSVNKKTGEFRDFSIITDGDILEITELFVTAREQGSS